MEWIPHPLNRVFRAFAGALDPKSKVYGARMIPLLVLTPCGYHVNSACGYILQCGYHLCSAVESSVRTTVESFKTLGVPNSGTLGATGSFLGLLEQARDIDYAKKWNDPIISILSG